MLARTAGPGASYAAAASRTAGARRFPAGGRGGAPQEPGTPGGGGVDRVPRQAEGPGLGCGVTGLRQGSPGLGTEIVGGIDLRGPIRLPGRA